MDLENHPSVLAYRQAFKKEKKELISRDWVKEVVRAAGADDVGVVEVDRPGIQDQKQDILAAFPRAKTLISFIGRMNPTQVRSSDRSLIDAEFVALEEMMFSVSRKAVRVLREEGIAAITPTEAFPQDMNKWPGRMFTVSHKPVAAAAGLGMIGHHRLLIHPVFGSHVCLGTIIIDAVLDSYDQPLDFNPCLDCKLCVGVCPTGAINQDGTFQFFQCLVHAYRDRLGGFINWVEALVDSNGMEEYRKKRSDSETMAVWQSLTYGGGYRCGYCMTVCPAGLDLIGPFLDNRKEYIQEVVKPLRERKENVYVLPGADFEAAVSRRFPNKTARPA